MLQESESVRYLSWPSAEEMKSFRPGNSRYLLLFFHHQRVARYMDDSDNPNRFYIFHLYSIFPSNIHFESDSSILLPFF